MRTLSKTLHPDDYNDLTDEVARVGHARNIFAGLFDPAHQHRAWEYAIALAALGTREAIPGKTVLDVGGGPSPLGGIVAWGGAKVVVNDVGDNRAQQEDIDRRALADPAATPGGSLTFVQSNILDAPLGKFNAVFCTSVIEHLGDPDEMVKRLADAVLPGGVLVITTDFHPSGQAQCEGHVRTHTAESLDRLANLAHGFGYHRGFPDWSYFGEHVYTYSFASLVLKRHPA